MSTLDIRLEDAESFLRSITERSVDAIVTDPPYGLSAEPLAVDVLGRWFEEELLQRLRRSLPVGVSATETLEKMFPQETPSRKTGFMGHEWDQFVPGPSLWREVWRVLKPGGHVIAFGGTRTWDWTSLALRVAGFEKRDSIAWIRGGGMPKGRDMGEILGEAWRGWSTTLAPRHEPILVFRKPVKATVADNVREHGTGLLNINDCRMVDDRWPSNVALDETTQFELDDRVGPRTSGSRTDKNYKGSMQRAVAGRNGGIHRPAPTRHQLPSAFFFCPRAPRSERNLGCEHLRWSRSGDHWQIADSEATPAYIGNPHCAVKPIELMRWLVRLVTPVNGLVIDPFLGSGTTGVAAILEGVRFAGCDFTPWAFTIAKARCAWARGDTAALALLAEEDCR